MSATPTASDPEPAQLALAEELFTAMGQLRRQARRHAGRPWPVDTVSGAQVDLIRLVRRRPATSVAEAAEVLGLAANTVSTLVSQLVTAGVLERTPDPNDRRVARLALTATAQRRVDRWRDQRAAVLASALGSLSADDRTTLRQAAGILGRLSAGLPNGRGAAPDA
ncbi:MAG TPA: MarR family transcriptional regulator [Jatrophihabitantaceae bacterium]|jgi:DNA-binding MarR family transcriptional regulator